METKRGGRVRVYATAQDRHRAFRLRHGVKVKKPVILAGGGIHKTENDNDRVAQERTP